MNAVLQALDREHVLFLKAAADRNDATAKEYEDRGVDASPLRRLAESLRAEARWFSGDDE